MTQTAIVIDSNVVAHVPTSSATRLRSAHATAFAALRRLRKSCGKDHGAWNRSVKWWLTKRAILSLDGIERRIENAREHRAHYENTVNKPTTTTDVSAVCQKRINLLDAMITVFERLKRDAAGALLNEAGQRVG